VAQHPGYAGTDSRNSYRLLSRNGRNVTRQHIQGDVDRLFCSNFEGWIGR
jgi:hypothetical protein